MILFFKIPRELISIKNYFWKFIENIIIYKIIYYEGAFYDITPLDTALTGATFDTTDTSATVTVNYNSHGLDSGDLFTFTNVTPPSGAGYVAADLKQILFK